MANPPGDWPPALRYVHTCLTSRALASRSFAACTDANRQAVSNELKALIFQAVQDGSLHTKDWSRVHLRSLTPGTRPPKPMPTPGKKRGAASDTKWTPKASKSPRPAFGLQEDAERREKRQRRFEQEQAAFQREQQADLHSAIASTSLGGRLGAAVSSPLATSTPPPEPNPNVIDWDAHTIVGTSTKLEKPYLRLTSAPDPKTVRPLATLRKTLHLLTQKWKAEKNYAYICDQFKSMRQDLTVQRIKNDFTVQVYETHARIALEKGDLGEYNQCQTQLRSLYAYDLPGCTHEFLAYRILYLLHTRNQRDINALMAELSEADKRAPAVAHALHVRTAMRAGNYHAFFQLYQTAPNMNAYIMDHFMEHARVQALLILAKSFRPSCALTFLARELGWADVAEADAFLQSVQAAIYVTDVPRLEDAQWDAKRAQEPLSQAMGRYRHVDVRMGCRHSHSPTDQRTTVVFLSWIPRAIARFIGARSM